MAFRRLRLAPATGPRAAASFRGAPNCDIPLRHVKTVASCVVLTAISLVVPIARGSAACPGAAPGARWTLVSDGGVAWLVTPCGERFYSIGINGLDGGAPQRRAGGRIYYHWPTFFPHFGAWLGTTRARVVGWGFNTASAGSLPPRFLRLPVIPNLDLGLTARFHWIDPFDPAAERRVRAWARRLVAPYRGDPRRIGYFTDNEVGWWSGALFDYYAKRRAANRTKQRLVALLREHYAGDWDRFTRDFVPPAGVGTFDGLLERRDRPRLRPGGAGIAVIRRWTGLVAERYYRMIHEALRAADPDALIFGDRLPIYYDPVAVRAMAPWVDAIATNYNVDSPDGWVARYYFEGLRQLTGGKPVLVSEWFFAAEENRSGNRNNGHLMTVGTQAERARGAAAAAEHFARQPTVVGSHWFQYYDHPRGGREDGEDYDFGLVDIDDRPYEALVEALARTNVRLAAIHRNAADDDSLPRGTWAVPRADIDAGDRSLAEWPKEAALVPELAAPGAEVPFGDFFLAWSGKGLALALIAMDYYDPDLLAYGKEFPRGEAFRVDWGVDAGRGPRRFSLSVIPPKVFPAKSAPLMQAELCRHERGRCDTVPAAIATYFGSDQPRITVEAVLPWSALGVDGPPPPPLRMQLAATAFHRSRWMSWNGAPPEAAMQDSSGWREIPLTPPH